MKTMLADPGNVTILIVTLLLGFAFAIPVTRRIRRIQHKPVPFFLWYSLMILIYLIEGAAFAAGMATNVFTIALSFVWGCMAVFVTRHSNREDPEILKGVLLFAVYTSLPALSFLSVPCMFVFSGLSAILTVQAGRSFGIPGFVPWPANTILGFSLIVSMSALFFKTVITTGIVSLCLHFRKRAT